MNPVATYLLGAAAMVAALRILVPVQPAALDTGVARRVVAALVFALPMLAILWIVVSGDGGDRDPALDSLMAMQAPVASGASKEDTDWAMITHAFLGGPPPRSGAAQAPAGAAMQRAQLGAAELEALTEREPGNVEAWLALAQAHRVAREFQPATVAYEAALKIDPRNADAWADYADALASSNGRRLAGAPADAIDHALRIDPDHLKGLWLAASLDLEERRYADALARWQKLRAVLPPGSPDASIIDANIAEARQLAAQAPPG